jgi:hypothetical protein
MRLVMARDERPTPNSSRFPFTLLGLTRVKARDLAGYSILQLIILAPVVLIMLWALGLTLPYVATIVQ